MISWASWADALSMIQTRLPEIADAAMRQMGAREATGCLAELQESTRALDLSGFVDDDHNGLIFETASAHLLPRWRNRASGSTAGSTTRKIVSIVYSSAAKCIHSFPCPLLLS